MVQAVKNLAMKKDDIVDFAMKKDDIVVDQANVVWTVQVVDDH